MGKWYEVYLRVPCCRRAVSPKTVDPYVVTDVRRKCPRCSIAWVGQISFTFEVGKDALASGPVIKWKRRETE